MGAPIYTLGHSTRSQDELIDLLRGLGVTTLADVRSYPRSRTNPQFNTDVLGPALRARGIGYVHLRALGGRRRARPDSINTGWRSASFRGFADYMQTDAFEAGLAELLALVREGTVAIMCAEAVPWRCHRSLVADALLARGLRVEDVTGRARSSPHRLTPFARVAKGRVTYPGGGEDQGAAAGEAKMRFGRTSGDDERGGHVDAHEDDGSVLLATCAPFHLEATVRVLQRRPTNLVERWEDGRYVRALRAGRGLAIVEVEQRGSVDAPELRLAVRHGDREAAPRFAPVVRTILGLDVDPRPIERVAESVRRLRPTALALRGMRPPRFPSLFAALLNVIPFQQVSLDAGLAVSGRLVERFGPSLDVGGRTYRAYPSAEEVAGARMPSLRACGLSASKAEALRGAARAIANGELREEAIATMPTADALEALTELRGIGPWSAALVLLRGLGRLDVFPAGDVGVARGLGALLHVDRDGLARVAKRFGDVRGYLYFCSLGASLLEKDLIHAASPR